MKTFKRCMALAMTLLMVLTAFPLTGFAADNYYSYLVYSDIQADKDQADQRYGTNTNSIYSHRVNHVYLAQNEYEGFQFYYYERVENKTVHLVVSDFVNDAGEKLESSVYEELYIIPKATGVQQGIRLADALVPYDGGDFEVVANENVMFYIELHSAKNQTPGNYSGTVTLYEGDNVIVSLPQTVTVWNFALPEGHYSTFVGGLYNTASGYNATKGFLELGGVHFENGDIKAEDIPLAESILEGWDEYLLDYGITSFELPRFLIDNDAKAAELAMADPRRSIFCVPMLSYDVYSGSLSSAAVNKIAQYRDIISGNGFLEDKAIFYVLDEPKWETEADTAGYDALRAAIKNAWGGEFHSLVSAYTSTKWILDKIVSTSDVLCFNQAVVLNPAALGMFTNGSAFKTFRYQGDMSYGNTYSSTWKKSTKGIYARILFWQAAALNSDGILHWNLCFNPYQEGKIYDVLKEGVQFEFPPNSVSNGNGDGLLMYQGASLGLDPTVPVASLRLKQVASGIDDYDYLMLAKEFLGEETYAQALKSILGISGTDDYGNVITNGNWNTWDACPMNNARVSLGNALSQANTEHNYGEWTTAVKADSTHNGMEIRVCADCGAQESRELTGCADGIHNWDDGTVTTAASCCAEGVKLFSCKNCEETKTEPVAKIPHTPSAAVKENVIPSTCTEKGSYDEVVYCAVCEVEIERNNKTSALAKHKDENGDGACDVCGADTQSSCTHLCHKTGFLGIIWKIANFFNKLFKINQYCECGAKHW